MTTLPAPAPATTDVAAADRALADRCQTSGDYLAGLIAAGTLDAGTLDAAGTHRKLPEVLFADHDPAAVREIWNAALAVGYRAGKLAGQPRWTPDALNRLRAAMQDAGYNAMAAKTARSASIHPPRHPADTEVLDHTTGTVRDGGHP